MVTAQASTSVGQGDTIDCCTSTSSVSNSRKYYLCSAAASTCQSENELLPVVSSSIVVAVSSTAPHDDDTDYLTRPLPCNDAQSPPPQQPLPQQQQHLLMMMLAQSNDIIRGSAENNYPTGCAFSPDGTCVLTATSSDGIIRLYDTPFGYLTSKGVVLSGDDDDDDDDDAVVASVDESRYDRIDREISQDGIIHEDRVDDDPVEEGGGFSHNQNYHPLSATPRKSSTTNNNNNNDETNHHHHHHHHAWTASLTSHLGGAPPPSSFASYAWYPHMNSTNPITSFYISCRGHSSPIHLIDAYTSQLRASYRPYNAVDEMEGPTVVAFRPDDGSKIYATGFKTDRTIVVFDTSIPGRGGLIARLGKTRRSKDGQKGIPSSIAFPKTYHVGDSSGGGGGTGGCGGPFSPNVFAVGTYSPASIYIYDDRMSNHSSCPPAGTIVLHGGLAVVGHGRAFSRKKRRFVEVAVGSDSNNSGGLGDNLNNVDDDDDCNDTNNCNLFSSARVNWFQSRARGGVTQLMWAPSGANNPYVLYSASRRSNVVLSWDVRALSGKDDDTKRSSRPICGMRSFAREDGDTNQRLQFDIDPSGKQMFVASGSGIVKIYDVEKGRLERTLSVKNSHGHAVNGVSYYPCSGMGSSIADKFTGLLAVAVGSRQFHDVPSDDEDDGNIAMSVQEESPGSIQLYGIT